MKVYGLKKCSTCQKAPAFLAERNITVQFTDHHETPPSTSQVAHWSRAALATKHTSLIRRPLIEHADGSVTVGFAAKIQSLFQYQRPLELTLFD